MNFNGVFNLKCGVQNYAWGETKRGDKNPYIADLLGMEAEAGKPFAELWIGAHPTLPATVSGEEELPLDKLIEKYPEDLLGKGAVEAGIKSLPYLLKVLSCDKPLSIQAHPDKKLAEKLHADDPEHYKDDNHKPEIAISLTGLDALACFRSTDDVKSDFARLKKLNAFFSGCPNHPDSKTWLRTRYARIFSADEKEVTAALQAIADEIKFLSDFTLQDKWFIRLLEEYPEDRGTLCAYFLNIIHLEPGEAVFLPANEPHAYLDGTIVECMASSDNVVRAGLTPKFIDRDVLVNMLTYEEGAPEVMLGAEVEGALRFQPPVPEFKLDRISLKSGAEHTLKTEDGISILLVLEGEGSISAPNGTVEVKRGSILLLPAALESAKLTVTGNMNLFTASPNPGGQPLKGKVKEAAQEAQAEEPVSVDKIMEEAASEEPKEKKKPEQPKPEVKQSVVDLEEEMDFDFGAMLEGEGQPDQPEIKPGDKVKGRITAMDERTVFVELGAKSEAVLDYGEILDKNGDPKYKVGDEVEAFSTSFGDEQINLTMKMSGQVADSALMDAYDAGIPVEGKVEAEQKGGYTVRVGSNKAFCPYSQIDRFRGEADKYVGQSFTFLITDYSEKGRNMIVSRRRLLEKERAKQVKELKETLSVGDEKQGTVTKIMDFGVFVDIGGMEGLVPMRELAWARGVKPEDILSGGDEVTVLVKEINWQTERITLSLRDAAGDPWNEVEEKFPTGTRCDGTVVKLMPFGAFVELDAGVEGLVHISKFGRRIKHPREVVKEGDSVEVSIEKIDLEQRRISLSMEDTSGKQDVKEIKESAKVEEGCEVTGTVDDIKDFGVFVKLLGGKSGLLHISQVKLKGSGNPRRALFDAYPPGSEIKVVVQQIKGHRISLTLRSTMEAESDQPDLSKFKSKKEDLGSIGGLFDNLDLKL